MTDTPIAHPTTPTAPTVCSLPADWPRCYLDELAAAIHFRTDIAAANSADPAQVRIVPIGFRPDDDEILLYRVYALLAVTTGTDTTLEHVHDAWAVWTLGSRPDHRSLIPFDRLSERVQALNAPYRDAIVDVARGHAAARKPKVLRGVGNDDPTPMATITSLLHQFRATRRVPANTMTLADRYVDRLIEDDAVPADLRAVLLACQRGYQPMEYDFETGPVAISVDETIAPWATAGFAFATERWQFDTAAPMSPKRNA